MEVKETLWKVLFKIIDLKSWEADNLEGFEGDESEEANSEANYEKVGIVYKEDNRENNKMTLALIQEAVL